MPINQRYVPELNRVLVGSALDAWLTNPRSASFRPVPTSSQAAERWCIHEGDVESACPLGNAQWHVRACTKHGHCVREKGRPVAAHLCDRVQE